VAAIEIERGDLIVRLSRLEQLAALRHELRVPCSAIEMICVDPDPWGALRGMRAPGTGIPGMIAYGVRRLTGRRPDFAALYGRGPAVRVELGPPSPFGRLIVSVADPVATVAALRV
jgi:hypothetical protein